MWYVLAIAILVVANWMVRRRTGLWVTPLSIVSALYFVPMLLATMRLSGLQGSDWHRSTIVVLGMSVIAWGVYPFLSLAISGRRPDSSLRLRNQIRGMSSTLCHVILAIGVIYVVAFVIENIVLTSKAVPLLELGTLAHDSHTKTLPVLNLITRGASAVVSLLFLVYLRRKQWYVTLLLVFVTFLPLTRGSRLDALIALVVLLVLASQVGVVRGRKVMLGVALAVAGIVLAFSAIGVVRSSFGSEKFEYASNLKLRVPGGAFGVSAAVYGNLAVPFENLDRLVRHNPERRTMGAFSLMPIAATPMPAARWFKYPTMGELHEFRDPVTPAGVSTAVAYFYMDFGAVGALVPMLFYMWLWLLLFRSQGRHHLVVLPLYGLYSGSFALASFQALMLNPAMYRRMLVLVLVFAAVELIRRRVTVKGDSAWRPQHGAEPQAS